MKRSILVPIFALAALSSEAMADSLPLRSFASCGYLSGQIYCFGGDRTVNVTNSVPDVDNNMYSLNITNFIGQPTENIDTYWNVVTPSVPFDPEYRRTPASVVLPDGKTFLIQGGHDMNYTHFTNQTILFDTNTNTYSASVAYSEPDRGARQIYYATAVNLPGNMVGFYGGMEQLALVTVPEVAAIGVAIGYDSNNGTIVGYTSLQTLSPGVAPTWVQYTPQNNVPPNYYPNSQTATFNPATNKIYYLGGTYYVTSATDITTFRPSLSWAYVFDTQNGAWNNETFTGVAPSGRIYHTADLLADSQTIILYGGTEGASAASIDYCYTLNTTSNVWTRHDELNVPDALSGPRFTHSSVLVNTTLFILFGRGRNSSLVGHVISLDVSNVTNIVYTPNFASAHTTLTAPSSINSTNDTTTAPSSINSTYNENGSGGLSKGAIGGAAAGCVVGVLGLAAFVFVCIRRKSRKSRTKEFAEHNNKQDLEIEPIHVDWDKIENEFHEVPLPAVYSPKLAGSLETDTRVDSPTNTSLTSGFTGSNPSPNVNQASLMDRTESSRHQSITPDVVASGTKPDTNNEVFKTVKPDGNF